MSKTAQYTRTLRAKRKAKGVCQFCGKHRTKKSRCKHCLERLRAESALKRVAGVCRYCGRETYRETTRCTQCRAGIRALYREKLEAGICVHCKQASVAGAFCLFHWFKNIGGPHGLGTKNGGILILQQLWEEQKGRCAVTNSALTPGVNASLDHIIPRSKGGRSTKENLRWVLLAVNRAKHDMLHEEFIELCLQIVKTHEQKVGFVVTKPIEIQRSN